MSTHDVRPRVIAAVSNLHVFTVAQLCEAARLEKRDQAYSQIDRLRKEGYLSQRQLPTEGRRHRPLTQYRLTSDPVKREEFAREVVRYRPVGRQGDESVGSEVLRQANASLDALERQFDRIETASDPDAGLEQLSGLDDELENAGSNIETAFMEYGAAISPESTPDHPAILTKNRWRAAHSRRGEIENNLKSRRMSNTAKGVALAVAGVIARAAVGSRAPQIAQAIAEQLRGNRWKAESPIMERFLDEMSDAASANDLVGRFFRSACAVTQDSKALSRILKTLSGLNAPWLAFNEENVHLLTHSKIDWERWLLGYQELGQSIDISPRPGALGVYSCLSKDFSRDAYLTLTRQNRLSVVSRETIDFLGASQPVSLVLLSAHRSHWHALECSHLDGEKTLHAYGPLAQDIPEVPGSPLARVAGCLGYWGIELRPNSLKRITHPLQTDRTLIVMQNPELRDPRELSRQIVEVLPEVEEIAVRTA